MPSPSSLSTGAPPEAAASIRPGRWAIALAGALSLAVAMGIGRFAFTPLLPMMLHDGVIDLHHASWLASANYLGYLVGALLCTFQPWIWARAPALPLPNATKLIRAGLIATVLLTAGMALPLPAAWLLLRFGAGVASAVVFVYTSGWCLSNLALRGSAALGGVMFAGPGAGIVLSGLLASAMVPLHWHAAWGWTFFGLLALLLTAIAWQIFEPVRDGRSPANAPSAAATTDLSHGPVEMAWLTLAYGFAGFGYIITATFLPVIARAALPGGSIWIDMFWPIFGFGVMLGALLSTRLKVHGDMRLFLAGSYLVQACAIGSSLAWPTLSGFALGSLFLGIPFTAITFFGMQEVRRLRPDLVAPYMGLLTAMYGVGQIVGPPMVAFLLKHSASAGAGFSLALDIAAAALIFGALLYLVMVKIFPKRGPLSPRPA